MLKFLFVFIVMPVVEFYLIYRVGLEIGWGNTVLALLTGVVAGTFYIRKEGFGVLVRTRQAMMTGKAPNDALFDTALVIVGGIMLILPGFISDVIGISLIFPFTRKIWKILLAAYLLKKIASGKIHVNFHNQGM